MLTVNVGGMFSGKSTELIRQGERHLIAGDKIMYFKPAIDIRYADTKIVTHTGKAVDCIPIGVTESLFDYMATNGVPDVILLDEAQFFDRKIIDEIMRINLLGVKIYVSGLDLNYLGKSFEITRELMALADRVQKFKAVCVQCKRDANVTGLINQEEHSGEIIQLGAGEKYIPLCWDCYEEHILLNAEEIEEKGGTK